MKNTALALHNGVPFRIEVEPWPEQFQSWVDDALRAVPVHNVNFHIHRSSNWPPPFAGNAGFDSDSTYSVTVSSYWMEKCNPIHFEPYMKWVLRHELRHCKPKPARGFTISQESSLLFRSHDIILYDIGWEDREPQSIGFFWEDFDEIKCCDSLMRVFQNVEGIEEYL